MQPWRQGNLTSNRWKTSLTSPCHGETKESHYHPYSCFQRHKLWAVSTIFCPKKCPPCQPLRILTLIFPAQSKSRPLSFFSHLASTQEGKEFRTVCYGVNNKEAEKNNWSRRTKAAGGKFSLRLKEKSIHYATKLETIVWGRELEA